MRDDDLAPHLEDYFRCGAAQEDEMNNRMISTYTCDPDTRFGAFCIQIESYNGRILEFDGKIATVKWSNEIDRHYYEEAYLRASIPQVLMEDDMLHTDDNGYECDEPDCPCHWVRRTQEVVS